MITQYKKFEKNLVAVDCIIFGFDGKELKVLLTHRQIAPDIGKWSLMGGFVSPNENVNDAAGRVLSQLTGLSSIYMEQLSCFGDVSRDPGGRVISIAYFALMKIDDYNKEMMEIHNTRWFPLSRIPTLVFDHKKMIALARERLLQKVRAYPVGFALLPEKFTLQQLLSLYEAIFETAIDKRNFTRKILSLGILKKLNEKEKESSRKGAYYFVFDKQRYKRLENEGLKLF